MIIGEVSWIILDQFIRHFEPAILPYIVFCRAYRYTNIFKRLHLSVNHNWIIF